jgi:uracil-DNA glycosylase family 4
MKRAGFFKPSQLIQIRKPDSRLPKCDSCLLYKTCTTKKMRPAGDGLRRILIVGEAPGRDEDEQGEPFVGASGRLLCKMLRKVGIDPNKDVVKTNALICRPPRNATPTDNQILWCRPNLVKTIEQVKPHIIVPLGRTAIRSLLGKYWKEDVGEVNKWVGFQIPHQDLNAWICPTWHPSYLLREDNPVLDLHFERHLAGVAGLRGQPWAEKPDYASRVECVADPDKAARILRKMAKGSGRLCLDYETNMLKPDSRQARIVCCAVCYEGTKTIAYPWIGDAVEATKELLLSDCEVMAHNLKFELRWTLAKLGIMVKNPVWCSMQNAHILDNREGITSLKFQAFVHLGQGQYNAHIEHLLQPKDGKGGNAVNRIDEIDPMDLLRYCGMDAVLEYLLAEKQMEVASGRLRQ